MKIESREYKLLINHELFEDPPSTVKAIWDEIEEATNTLAQVQTKGKFDEQESRRIVFFDTPDLTLRRNGLVLRQRSAGKALEYTLKCRSEDRYFAAGTDVRAADGLDGEPKLEEDIARPFRCRFSHSNTVELDGESDLARTPKTLDQASRLFPLLGTLRIDGLPCSPKTSLEIVNKITIDESVWKGGKIVFQEDGKEPFEKATVALILWARPKLGRPAVAELSFRIKDRDEGFNREVAQAGRSVYNALQRLDCSRPDGMTKTEYIYRDASTD